MIAKTIQGIAKAPFIQNLKEKNKGKIFIYPNLNGLGLGFFLIICFFRQVSYHFLAKQHIGFECAIYYWHFVDVV